MRPHRSAAALGCSRHEPGRPLVKPGAKPKGAFTRRWIQGTRAGAEASPPGECRRGSCVPVGARAPGTVRLGLSKGLVGRRHGSLAHFCRRRKDRPSGGPGDPARCSGRRAPMGARGGNRSSGGFVCGGFPACIGLDRAARPAERHARPPRPHGGGAARGPPVGDERSWVPEGRAFVQYHGSKVLDAPLLLMPASDSVIAEDRRRCPRSG